MPQLDTATYLPQLVWFAITFILLYVVLWRVALPRITGVLEERQARIDLDLARAEALKKEAAAALEAYEKTIADGRTQAQAMIRERAKMMAAEADERLTALNRRLSSEAAAAEERIVAAKNEAIEGILAVAVEAAQAAATKLIDAEVSEAEAEGAVAAVMKERG